jgi:hypothetical protein
LSILATDADVNCARESEHYVSVSGTALAGNRFASDYHTGLIGKTDEGGASHKSTFDRGWLHRWWTTAPKIKPLSLPRTIIEYVDSPLAPVLSTLSRYPRQGLPTPQRWHFRGADQFPTISFDEVRTNHGVCLYAHDEICNKVMASDAGVRRWLEMIFSFGFAMLTHVKPTVEVCDIECVVVTMDIVHTASNRADWVHSVDNVWWHV